MFTTIFIQVSIHLLTVNKFLIHKRRRLLTLKPSYAHEKVLKSGFVIAKQRSFLIKDICKFSTEIKFITNPNMLCLSYASLPYK